MTMTVDAARFAAELVATVAEVDEKARLLVVRQSTILQGNIKRHATGRPGPNMITGNFNRSIYRQVLSAGTGHIAVVGSNAPQAWRLEMGFHGADSLGRVYDQPPYPSFGPGFDDTVPGFLADIEALAASL